MFKPSSYFFADRSNAGLLCYLCFIVSVLCCLFYSLQLYDQMLERVDLSTILCALCLFPNGVTVPSQV